MEVVRIDLQSKDGRIAIAGDFHKGTVNCHHELIDEFVFYGSKTNMVKS